MFFKRDKQRKISKWIVDLPKFDRNLYQVPKWQLFPVQCVPEPVFSKKEGHKVRVGFGMNIVDLDESPNEGWEVLVKLREQDKSFHENIWLGEIYRYKRSVYFLYEPSCINLTSILHSNNHLAWKEYQVAYVSRKLLSALTYLHSNGVIHSDIKSDNIYVDIKTGNVGFVGDPFIRFLDNDGKTNGIVGTPFWMAPEVIKDPDYGAKADIWSFGILLFELFEGFPPAMMEGTKVAPNKLDELMVMTDAPTPTITKATNLSVEALDFINCCMQKDPAKRSSAKELLNHKFLETNKGALVNPLHAFFFQNNMFTHYQEVKESVSSEYVLDQERFPNNIKVQNSSDQQQAPRRPMRQLQTAKDKVDMKVLEFIIEFINEHGKFDDEGDSFIEISEFCQIFQDKMLRAALLLGKKEEILDFDEEKVKENGSDIGGLTVKIVSKYIDAEFAI